MLNNISVRTYPDGRRDHFRLIGVVKRGGGASVCSYDSGQKNREGYAREEEANQAGWKIIQCTLLNILNLFVKRWPKGCPAQEWQTFPAIGAPAVVWDRIFCDLVEGKYIQDQGNGYVITEKGKELRTQLLELDGLSSSPTLPLGATGPGKERLKRRSSA